MRLMMWAGSIGGICENPNTLATFALRTSLVILVDRVLWMRAQGARSCHRASKPNLTPKNADEARQCRSRWTQDGLDRSRLGGNSRAGYFSNFSKSQLNGSYTQGFSGSLNFQIPEKGALYFFYADPCEFGSDGLVLDPVP